MLYCHWQTLFLEQWRSYFQRYPELLKMLAIWQSFTLETSTSRLTICTVWKTSDSSDLKGLIVVCGINSLCVFLFQRGRRWECPHTSWWSHKPIYFTREVTLSVRGLEEPQLVYTNSRVLIFIISVQRQVFGCACFTVQPEPHHKTMIAIITS